MHRCAWDNDVVVDRIHLTESQLIANLERILADLKNQRPRYRPSDYQYRLDRLAQEAHWFTVRIPHDDRK